jgi:hypothetical protein
MRAAAAESLPVGSLVLNADRRNDRTIISEDQTQSHMRLATRAPAESEAERMADKD